MKKFLNGQTKELLRELAKKIKAAGKRKEFEEALVLREEWRAVMRATQEQKGLGVWVGAGAMAERGVKELILVLKSFGLVTGAERVEGFDVATLMQQDTVGGMVVFELGAAVAHEYRRFKIRDWRGGDPRALAEMVRRRFRHEEWPRPDLVLIDGGKSQLSRVRGVIPEGIPVIGLAKRWETIVIPAANGYVEVKLEGRRFALRLLQQIRDEAHRWTTGYHKQVRRKKLTKGEESGEN